MSISRLDEQRRRLALGLAAMVSLLAVVAVALPVSSAGRAPVLVRAFPPPPRTAAIRHVPPPHGARSSRHRERRVAAQRAPRVDHLRLSESSPSLFITLYRRASRAFGVSWRLVASIHEQETSFSSAAGTYHGLNFARCCAGPMQFNVTNGPVSTWDRFSGSFRRAERPARYPHRTSRHPSVYDDFDAIMAAGALLRASGAGDGLDGAAWRAAYDYYGHDETGLRYADQVLARAVGWTRGGLCVRCAVDPRLISEFDADFAGPYRAALIAEERRERAAAARHERHRRHSRKAGDRRRHRHRHAKRRVKHTGAKEHSRPPSTKGHGRDKAGTENGAAHHSPSKSHAAPKAAATSASTPAATSKPDPAAVPATPPPTPPAPPPAPATAPPPPTPAAPAPNPAPAPTSAPAPPPTPTVPAPPPASTAGPASPG